MIFRSMISSLLLFAAPLVLLSCPERTAKQPPEKVEPASVGLNQEFNLRVGQQVAVQGEKLKVKFVSVGNDSRCPVDVTCVWAGNAEVVIQAETNGKSAELKLNTNGGDKFPREVRHQLYTVVLVELSPQPHKDKAIKANDYDARLVIRKQ